MALANITNNILTDSGILVTNLTPTSRTITINGTTYDLSADRSWTIATGVGGSGTTNYLPKFTGTSTIGNSQIFDNGTNVGIGTASPTTKLSVYAATGGSSTGITINGSNNMLNLFGSSSSGAGVIFDATDGTVGSATGVPIIYRLGGTERMRLDTSGNLGLGVTPSAWATLVGLDIVEGGGAISSNQGGLYLSENAYFNAGWKYKSSSISSALYSQVLGVHAWYIAPSGTAGNAISFTQAMTLDASGRLGIGVTSPTTFLDINSGTNPPIIKLTSSAVGQIPFSIRANIPGFSNSGFSIYDETAAASRLVISSTGNVGIGTTSPATPLDVVAGSGGGAISLRTNASDIADLYFFSNNGSTLHSYLRGTSTELQIRSVTNIPMLFYTNNTERMRITSGGSVLIGTTTEGFLGKLQVAGSVAITGQYNTVLPSSSFSYFDGSGQVVSSASNASALYLDTTWNTTGNPDGIYLNVTNTASGASSKLLNLKVGSVSQFSVSKGGAIQTSDPTNGTARPWKLGDARSGTISTDSYIIVEVNGVTYSIPALNGLP